MIDIPPSQGKAAIRYKNPGAQWPSALAEQYGMLGYGHLSDGMNAGAGNKIALFPNAVCGAASNMALLAHSYVGLTVAAGQSRWSGGNRHGLPGWDGGTVITKVMARDPNFVIPFMKSIADFEAPGGSKVLSEAQWQEAFELYLTVEGAQTSKTTKKNAIIVGGTTTAAVAAHGAGLGIYVVIAIAVVGIAFLAYQIIRSRNAHVNT